MHQGFNVLNERNRCVMGSQQISAGGDGTLALEYSSCSHLQHRGVTTASCDQRTMNVTT